MADAFYRTVVTFPFVTGLPKDCSVNVWSFRHDDATDYEADVDSIHDRLEAFYETVLPYYSSRVDPALVNFKTFDLSQPQPRIPLFEELRSLSGGTAANMDFPSEVAMCLSFKAVAISGANARRRRGRVYLGPLQSSTTTDYYQILGAMVTATINAGTGLAAANSDGILWSIYSPYTHHGVPVGEKLDPEVYPENPAYLSASYSTVAKFWVDNEWDTQRRRGLTATSRTEVSV